MARIQGIDFLKGISIIGVFIIHVLGLTFTQEDITIYSLYFDSFFRFAVPIFFGVLGYMTYKHYQYVTDWKKFYRSKFMYLVIPYLLWSFAYLFVPTIYQATKESDLPSILQVLLGYTEVHLYFIIPYLTFLLFIPMVVRLIKVKGEHFVSKTSVYVIAIFIIILIFMEQSVMKQESHLLLNMDKRTIINWFGYYAIGLFISINSKYLKILFGDLSKMKKFRFGLIVTTYVVAVGFFTITAKVIFPYDTPFLLPLSVLVLIILLTVYEKNRGKKWIEQVSRLGTHTFPFYLSHVLFIKIGYLLFVQSDLTIANLTMVAIFGFACSLGYVWLHQAIVQFINKRKVHLEKGDK